MPSKLRKAIGAVKDQTSISLAKVTNAANLEVTILKATTHDKNPIEERYVNEIVQLVSSNKVYATACAQCIGKRIGKTRNWVVALKSLMIVLRIFQDGDPYFPREVFHAMKRGAKILNLSSFRDDSNSSPWDYTAFVRTFALYLDERLDCFLTGKLQRRFTYHNRFHEKNQRNKLSNEPGIKEMKPTMVLDKITHWQRLLDRAISTRPTGSAKMNRLVQISLYAIVQESFDLYRDISDGLAVVLDSFFQLPHQACVAAFQACVKSLKQFEELSAFYSLCTNIGVGRSYEYPSVQSVSEELIETLQEFLKDQASSSFPASNNGSKRFLSPATRDPCSTSSAQDESSGTFERFFEINGSDFGSQCTSLEDLMCATDLNFSPRRSIEQDGDSEQSDQDEKQSQCDEFASANGSGSGSNQSVPYDQTSRSSLEIISFEELQQEVQQDHQTNQLEQQNTRVESSNGSKDCWEIVLAKTVKEPAEMDPFPPKLGNEFDLFVTFLDQSPVPQHQYNPFLDDIESFAPPTTTFPTLKSQTSFDIFDAEPTFKATAPTLCAHEDPIVATTSMAPPTFSSDLSLNPKTNFDLTFGDINPNETTVAPNFRAQGSAETKMIVEPAFHAQCPFEIASAPAFHVHDSYETGIAPTFSVQNVNMPMEAPIFGAQSLDMCMVPLSFQEQNFYQSMVAPTFSAKDSNETTLAAPKDDDPFGAWPSSMTNEHAYNVSMHEQNLLRQQQLWLEQQNQIIARHLT